MLIIPLDSNVHPISSSHLSFVSHRGVTGGGRWIEAHIDFRRHFSMDLRHEIFSIQLWGYPQWKPPYHIIVITCFCWGGRHASYLTVVIIRENPPFERSGNPSPFRIFRQIRSQIQRFPRSSSIRTTAHTTWTCGPKPMLIRCWREKMIERSQPTLVQ